MTVRIGDVTFSDWISLPFPGGWTDTFIFRISAQACVPPVAYAPLLRRIVAHVRRKRSCASIWVQVDSLGEWFVLEVQRSLKGLKLPFVVTRPGEEVDYLQFPYPPQLLHAPLPRPPIVDKRLPSVTLEELRCLQSLGRMEKGNEDEISSLADLSVDATKNVLATLGEKELVVYKTSPKIKRDKSRSAQLEMFPLWHTTPKGLSVALRSWGVPKGIEFTSRLEKNRPQIGYRHRTIARIWPAWLKSAWPQAEIWAGWSEVHIPGISVIPDGLAWGRIQGYETLFWLAAGDEHKSRSEITELTGKRLKQAWKLCKRTGVRLVYTQLSTNWVHEAARWAFANLPKEVAVVMGDQRRTGELPVLEWGKATDN